MDDREKLIQILSVPIHPRIGADPAEVVADYLLDNEVRPVRHAHWDEVPSSDVSTGKAYVCSNCKKMRWGVWLPPYCACCGSKMEGKS